jgi:hypothetical protein
MADTMLDNVALKDPLAKQFRRPPRSEKLWLIFRLAMG